MKINGLILLMIFFANFAFSQVEFPDSNKRKKTDIAIVDNNNVKSNNSIDILLKKHIELNRRKQKTKGYRVQIFFASNANAKSDAETVRQEFLTQYEGYATYLTYNAPNFIVRVGDFRTKNEALKLYNTLKKEYLTAFIVPDEINFPLLKPVINYE